MDISTKLQRTLNDSRIVILSGAPSTGKTKLCENLFGVESFIFDESIARKCLHEKSKGSIDTARLESGNTYVVDEAAYVDEASITDLIYLTRSGVNDIRLVFVVMEDRELSDGNVLLNTMYPVVNTSLSVG